MDLNVGAISRSLLAAAGPGMQAELRANYPNGLGRGQVGRTKGHGLRCKSVYHATLLTWESSAAGEQVG